MVCPPGWSGEGRSGNNRAINRATTKRIASTDIKPGIILNSQLNDNFTTVHQFHRQGMILWPSRSFFWGQGQGQGRGQGQGQGQGQVQDQGQGTGTGSGAGSGTGDRGRDRARRRIRAATLLSGSLGLAACQLGYYHGGKLILTGQHRYLDCRHD